MKYKVLIRVFTARRDLGNFFLLKKKLEKQGCDVLLTSIRKFDFSLKYWKPNLVIVNVRGLSTKIKEISPKSITAYIPGEGSEVGELSDAYFWKNNIKEYNNTDLIFFWGNKQLDYLKKLINKKDYNKIFCPGNLRFDTLNYFVSKNKNFSSESIGIACRFSNINHHEGIPTIRALIQKNSNNHEKFEDVITACYSFKSQYEIIKRILEETQFKISIRPHPLESVDNYFRYILPSFGKSFQERITVDYSIEAISWLAKQKILVTPSSSVFIDAYLMDIPIINIDKLSGRKDEATHDIIESEWQKSSYQANSIDEVVNYINSNISVKKTPEIELQLKEYNNLNFSKSVSDQIVSIIVKKLKSFNKFNGINVPKFIIELLDDLSFYKAQYRNYNHWNMNYHKSKYSKPGWIDQIK